MSYQPPDAAANARPEIGVDASQDDWQRLLDLLEERTGAAYDDLWREWVTDDSQDALLDHRAEARAAYAATVSAAAPWQLPRDVRFDLGAWRFDSVDADLELAGEVLDARDEIGERAASLQLTPSSALREAFEGPGIEAAEAAATDELATLDEIADAADELDAPTTALETVGLIGAHPAARVDAARDAYEAGDLDAAGSEAAAAAAIRDGADEAGRLRVGIAGGSVLALDLLAMAALSTRRRSSRRSAAARRAAAERAVSLGEPRDDAPPPLHP